MNHTKPSRKSDIHAQQAGDETLLYSPTGGAVHVLNPTAYLLWERCDGQHSVADMVQELRDHFAVAQDHDLEGDVRHTVKTFVEKGLLVGSARFQGTSCQSDTFLTRSRGRPAPTGGTAC